MQDIVLEVNNITKIYKIYKKNIDRILEIFSKKIYHKKFIANNDISFILHKGETLGIIGTNGAGKSTILKIIAGVIEPTLGEVKHKGRVTALLELGTGFNYELTGYENIFLNATMIGMAKKEIEKNLEDIIEFSELGDYIYEPIKTYSSGMIMRLAFSIALFSKPDILIVDEALSVGDAHFSAKCTRALKKRKKEDMSIIYVSHDLNSLKLLCDRVILLNNGQKIDDGDSEKVINHYNKIIAELDSEKYIRQDKENSFGTLDIKIEKLSIVGKNSNSNIISSGEEASIIFEIFSTKDITDINIGFVIRDKFGQDIFGTNSKLMKKLYNFKKNKRYRITFDLRVDIGSGKYTISAALAQGDNHLEGCLHWFDFATDFEIAGNYGDMFIGITKLYPNIKDMEEL